MVIYLSREYEFFRVKRILEQLAAGHSLDVSLREACGVSVYQLEQDWKQWLIDQVR